MNSKSALYLLSLFIFFLAGCDKEENTNDDLLSDDAAIVSFKFTSESNPSLEEDILLTIDGNFITASVPYGTDLKNLKADFEFDGLEVKVRDRNQVSGESSIDYTSTVEFEVYAKNGTVNSYEVYIQYFTGLPVIQVFTENNQVIDSKEDYVKGTVRILGNTNYTTESKVMEIRGRGNSTWTKPKKPYQIKLDEKADLFNMGEDKRWILLANYTDKTMLRNLVGFELGYLTDLDWTPQNRFVELFINDNYQGTYQLAQKVERSNDRVDLSNDGFLLEVDQLSRLDDNDVYFETDRYLFNIKEPALDFNDNDYNYVKNRITEFENVLFSEDFDDPELGYKSFIDLNSFVDWYLINELTKNNDAQFFSSVYLNLEPSEKIRMGPLWDFDISLGNINYNGNENPVGFWIKDSPWISRMFQDDIFKEAVKSRWKDYSGNREEILKIIRDNSALLENSQRENFERWDILGELIWPNYVSFDSYEEEVNYLIQWLNTRWDWMDAAIGSL